MKTIGINMHAPCMFVYMAYLLRDALSGEPHFPPSGLNGGRGLTQEISLPQGKVAMHVTTNHYTDIFTVDEETEEGINELFSFSLNSSISINGLEVKHPSAKICDGLKFLPNSPDYRNVHDAFFKAYFMAGVVIETTQFKEIAFSAIINNLQFAFQVRDSVRRQIDPADFPWVQNYLSKMKKAIVH